VAQAGDRGSVSAGRFAGGVPAEAEGGVRTPDLCGGYEKALPRVRGELAAMNASAAARLDAGLAEPRTRHWPGMFAALVRWFQTRLQFQLRMGLPPGDAQGG